MTPLRPTGLMTLLLIAGCYTVNNKPLSSEQKADQLANGVVLASGGAAWPRVTKVSFAFVVRDGGDVKLSRSHIWNVREGTDIVTVGDRTTQVNLMNPPKGEDAPPEQRDAFKAWTNDSYWLLAPLKLFDKGAMREYEGRVELFGKGYEVLHMHFKDVGMTPDDHYRLYVDPFTSLVAYWDYMPDPDKTVQASWEQYRHKGGLKLSTFHKLGNRTITIEDLTVVSE